MGSITSSLLHEQGESDRETGNSSSLVQARQDVEDQVGHETWAIRSCAAEYFTRYLSTNTYSLLPRAVELCLIKPPNY